MQQVREVVCAGSLGPVVNQQISRLQHARTSALAGSGTANGEPGMLWHVHPVQDRLEMMIGGLPANDAVDRTPGADCRILWSPVKTNNTKTKSGIMLCCTCWQRMGYGRQGLDTGPVHRQHKDFFGWLMGKIGPEFGSAFCGCKPHPNTGVQPRQPRMHACMCESVPTSAHTRPPRSRSRPDRHLSHVEWPLVPRARLGCRPAPLTKPLPQNLRPGLARWPQNHR